MRDNSRTLTWVFLFVGLLSAIAVVIAAWMITNGNKLQSATSLTQSATLADSLPTPQGILVFDEDFDDGVANGIATANTKWEIIENNNKGKLFQLDNTLGSDWISFTLATISIGNGTIEYKVNLADYRSNSGATACHFRSTLENRYVLGLAADTNSISINYQGTDTNDIWHPLGNAVAAYKFAKNTWHDVRIDLQGSDIIVYLDAQKILTATDDRLKKGEINCAVAPSTVAQFDDIRVWSQP